MEMSWEVLSYLLGALLVPSLGFAIRGYWMLSLLLAMHQDPERYGFGTISLNQLIQDNSATMSRLTDCVEDLATVLRWLVSKGEKDEPPPQLRQPH